MHRPAGAHDAVAVAGAHEAVAVAGAPEAVATAAAAATDYQGVVGWNLKLDPRLYKRP